MSNLARIVNAGTLSREGIEGLLRQFFSKLKKTSVEAYQADIREFAAFCKEPIVTTACANFLKLPHGKANMIADQFRSSMITKKLSSNTINRRLAALRSICKLAHKFGMIQWQLSVDNVRKEMRRNTRGPGLEGVRKMLQYAQSQPNEKKRYRDVAMITLFFTDGLRRNELLSADLSDLDLAAGTIFVLGKGKNEKVSLPLPEITVQALKNWLVLRGTEAGPIFVNQSGTRISGRGIHFIISSIGEKVGIDTRPHGLRHTCFTHGAKQGIPLHELQVLSRHADIRTLSNYLDQEAETAKIVANKISEGLE